MAITLATLSGTVADLVGDVVLDDNANNPNRRVKVVVDSNAPDDYIADLDNNVMRLGTATVTPAADGTWSFADLIATGSADTNLDDSANLQYTVTIDYPRASDRQRIRESFGPFALEASSDVTDLVEAQTLTATYQSAFMDQAQELLDAQIALSGIEDTDSAVGALIANPGTLGPLTGAALSGAYGRGAVDVRSFGAALDGTTDDAAAIQAALDTGLDVYIARLNGGALIDVKVGSTLTMDYAHPGQKLVTIGARLLPSHVGDCIQLDGDLQHAEVHIAGDLQPGAGDFSEVAAIRVGSNSTGTYASPGEWPFQPSVARSVIRGDVGTPFKGNGIIWENGPMLDLTQTYISDVTHDGVRAGGVADMWDPNHGLFVGTHVIRAGRYGYHIKRRVTVGQEFEDSRFNKFVEAKAYDCGVKDGSNITTSGGNFRIETNSNWGSIFSELGIVTLTADSYANRLELEPFNAMSPLTEDVYGHDDDGAGNRLEGMSYWERYETIKARFHRVEVNARFAGQWYREQTGANTFLDKIVDSGADTYIDYDPDTGFARIDRFNGHLELPGTTARVGIADSETGILTVPAATTVAAGGSWTSGVLAAGKSQYANGFASMFDQSPDLVITVIVTSGFDAKLVVRNLSGAGIDISAKMIRWTVLSYRN